MGGLLSYERQPWEDYPSEDTSIDAVPLKHIEDGIGDVSDRVDQQTVSDAGEGLVYYRYGASRGYNTGNAAVINFDRIKRRIRTDVFFNGSFGGILTPDATLYAYGSFSLLRQGIAATAQAPSSGPGTFPTIARFGGLCQLNAIGADAAYDGYSGSGGTPTKSRAGFVNALRAWISLMRTEIKQGSYVGLTATWTTANNTIASTVVRSYMKGYRAVGTGIPANSFVGVVTGTNTAGTSFLLVDGSGNPVTPTVAGTAAALGVFPPVTGTWIQPPTSGTVSTSYSNGSLQYSTTPGATSTYPIVIAGGPRRVWWLTMANDDDYTGYVGASFSITVTPAVGSPYTVVGTTSQQHRRTNGTFAGLGFGNMVVDLGTLPVGTHSFTVTHTGASGSHLVDCGANVESLTPPTCIVEQEVPISATGYAAFTGPGVAASWANQQIYNNLAATEVANTWPNDGSVLIFNPNADGTWDYTKYIGPDFVHYNDPGEAWYTSKFMPFYNAIVSRNGFNKV